MQNRYGQPDGCSRSRQLDRERCTVESLSRQHLCLTAANLSARIEKGYRKRIDSPQTQKTPNTDEHRRLLAGSRDDQRIGPGSAQFGRPAIRRDYLVRRRLFVRRQRLGRGKYLENARSLSRRSGRPPECRKSANCPRAGWLCFIRSMPGLSSPSLRNLARLSPPHDDPGCHQGLGDRGL